MNKWNWRAATGVDVPSIIQQAAKLFEIENPAGSDARRVFEIDPLAYSHKITLAIVNQFYNPGIELFLVAVHQDTQEILAHTWAHRGSAALWSTEEMCQINMAHVNYDLPTVSKIKLIAEMMDFWEAWCQQYQIKIIHSSTMRIDTQAFLRLHSKRGYSVRGNNAYKRLDTTAAGLPIP